VPAASLDTMGEHFLKLWETLDKKSNAAAVQEAAAANPDRTACSTWRCSATGFSLRAR